MPAPGTLSRPYSVSLTSFASQLLVRRHPGPVAARPLRRSLGALAAALAAIVTGALFGQAPATSVGQKSATQTATVTITTAGSLSDIAVLTRGATGLDFQAVTPNTAATPCTVGTFYDVGDACTVQYTFSPVAPWTRQGAIRLGDSLGNVLGQVFLSGVGNGPQVSFPLNASTPRTRLVNSDASSGLGYSGIAVDGRGDVFLALNGEFTNTVKEIVAVNGVVSSSSTVRTLVRQDQFEFPSAVAVDGAGNVYVADTDDGEIDEILAIDGVIPTYPTVLTLASGFTQPTGIAVDGSGNVYYTDRGSSFIGEIVAVNGVIPASPTINHLGSDSAVNVAVDASGDVFYVAISGNLKELVAVNGSVPLSNPAVRTLRSDNEARSLAVDGSGNVYVGTAVGDDQSTVEILLAVSGTVPTSNPTVVSLGTWSNPAGLAVDASGNLFVLDIFSGASTSGVWELSAQTPPTVTFNSTVVGTTSLDSPRTVTIGNNGNEPLQLASGNNPTIAQGFSLGSSSTCTSNTSVPAGASCTQYISYTPVSTSDTSGTSTITDNNLNAVDATQTISLNGTAILTVPDAPTIGTAIAGDTNAMVSFTAPVGDGGSSILSYTVTSSPGGIMATGSASPITVTGLTDGTAYTFTVTATNAQGTGAASAPSNAVTPATKPSAPTSVVATAGNAQATVTFAAAANGGSPITGYTVTSHPIGGTDSNAGSTSLSHIVTGLVNGRSYHFTVVATNTVGSSGNSADSNSVIPSTVPGAPVIGTATAGNRQATVTFSAPASNGGSAITGYTVTSNPAGGVDSNAGSTSLSHTMTGLSDGISYTFTVVASNVDGPGPASAASNSVTPEDVFSAALSSLAVTGSPTVSGETVNVVATVVDTSGNPVAGVTVAFAQTNPGGFASQGASFSNVGTTDASGIATATLSDTIAESLTVSATVSSSVFASSGTFSQTPTATFVAPAYVVSVNTDPSSGTGTASNCIDPNISTSGNTNCSLRDAVAAANALNRVTTDISFASSLMAGATTANPVVIQIQQSTPIVMSNNMNINGPGANLLKVEGGTTPLTQGNFPIFVVNGSDSSSISGMTLANGTGSGFNGSQGGAISSYIPLTVTGVTFSGNLGASQGGAIYSPSPLTVANSTFSNNATPASGGAIASQSPLTVTNSTFLGNSASAGGAIDAAASLTLTNSTFSQNLVLGHGGAIAVESGAPSSVTNSIFSGDTAAGGGSGVYSAGGVTASYLVNDGGGETFVGVAPTNLVTSSAKLSALGYHGGSTETLLPLPGSSAICAGTAPTASTDQRGVAISATRYAQTGCYDIGAVQTEYALAFTTSPGNTAVGSALAPTPVVTVSEDGTALTAGSASVAMSAAAGTLNGTTTEGTSTMGGATAGEASFPGLSIGAVESGDTLTATLAVASAFNLTATSNAFDVTTVAVSATNSSLTASPSPAVAGSAVTVTATVKDSGNNPVSGASVTFGAGSSTTATFSNVTATNASGVATATLTDTAAETVTLSAVVSGAGTGSLSTTMEQFVAPAYIVTASTDAHGGIASNCVDPNIATSGNTACELRDAIAAANALTGVTTNITFAPSFSASSAIITEGSAGTLTLAASMKIVGPGQTLLAIDGANLYPLLVVSSGVTAAISGVTMQHGHSTGVAEGSGGINNSGMLTITDSTITQNYDAAGGSAIISSGVELTLTGCTVSNNTTGGGGGPVVISAGTFTMSGSSITGNTGTSNGLNSGGGGILIGKMVIASISNSTISGNVIASGAGGGVELFEGSATLTNVTVSGNSAALFGGGIFNYGGTLTLIQTTITGNSAPNGGGIYDEKQVATVLTNSVVAGNSASASSPNIGTYTHSTAPTDDGGNYFDTVASGSALNPELAVLGNYGGSTQTQPGLPGSPVLCSGLVSNVGNLTTDQRGNPRVATYGTNLCVDSGAVQTAYSLSFSTQPSNTETTVAISPAPAVVLEDNGVANGIPGASIPVALANGTLNGTATKTTDATGTAIFTGLSVPTPETGDTLTTSVAAGTNIITATSNAFNVLAVDHLAITVPSTAVAGTPFNATVTAYLDHAGTTVATGYTGPITFTSTDLGAVLPGSTNLTAGLATVSLTLKTAGNQTISAQDASGSPSGTSTPIAVGASTAASVSIVSGNNQSATVNTAFALPLIVVVKDQYGNAVGSATVTATAPVSSSPSATFGSIAATDSNGQTSISATANSLYGGPYTVSVGSGSSTAATFSLTNNPAQQTIMFPQPASPLTYTSGLTTTLTATASSGLTVTYRIVSGTASVTGSTLTYSGPGAVVVEADQAGNSTYAAATEVQRMITVNANPTIAFAIPNHTYGDAPFTVAATSNSTGAFTYSLVSGNATVTSAGLVTITGTGSVTVMVSQAASGYYLAATQNATFNIASATPAISFFIPNHTYGDAPFSVAATSNSTGAFTYSLVSGNATVSPAGLVTLTGAGPVVVQASEAADANYVAATKQASFTVAAGTPTIGFSIPNHTYGDAPFSAAATSNSTGAFTYSLVSGNATVSPAGLVTLTGTGPVVVLASEAADSNYVAGTKQASFTVAAGTPTIGFSIPNHTYGDAPFSVVATSNSTGAFTYSLVSGNATVSASGLVTLTGTGPVVVLASEAADANYVAATKQASFTVAAGTPTIGFSIPNHTYGDAPFTVAATSNSTGAFTYSLVSGNATVSPAGLVTLTGTGPVVVLASEAADSNYVAGTKQASFTVAAGTPTIGFSIPNHTYGDAPFSVVATSNSTGAFTYSLVSGNATVSASGLVTLTGTGPVVVLASEAADANYVAATKQASFTVAAGTPTIGFSIPNHTYGDAPFTVAATSNSTGAFTYSLVSGNATVSPAGLVTLTGTGPVVVLASEAADSNYVAGTKQASFTVAAGTPTIGFSIPNHTYGDAPFSVVATSNSTGAFTYSLVSGNATVSASGLVTLTGTGPVVVLASEAADANYVAATKQASFTVAAGTPTIGFSIPNHTYGDAPFSVVATSNSTGAFTYSLVSGNATVSASGLVTLTGTGPVVVLASEAADANYVAATKQASFTVAAGTPTIGFSIPNHTYGDAPFSVAATSNSTGAFTYSLVSGNATVSASGLVTLTGTGPVVVQASEAADTNYVAATKQASFTVAAGSPTIGFSIPNHTYGDAPFSVVATSNSTGAFTYSLVSGNATVSPAGLVTLTGDGTIVVLATEASDSNFVAATKQASFSVAMAQLTVSANNATRVYGAPNPAFTGTVTGAKYSDSFTESFSTSATTTSVPGPYSIVPSVAGWDLSDYTVAMVNGTLTIAQAPSITALSVSSTTVNPNQTVTLTALVSSTTTGTPTGSVTFSDNGNALQTVALASGSASYTTLLSPGTTHTLTASYAGDTNFLPSASSAGATTVTVAPLDFTFSFTGENLTVAPGKIAVYSFAVSPLYGSYAGPITFSVTGLPPGATAVFSPANLPASSGPQTVTLSVQTAASTASREHGPRGWSAKDKAPAILAALLLPLFGFRRLRELAGRRVIMLLLAIGGLGAVATLSGCGSGTGFGTQEPQTYTLTVTATSGTLVHTSTVKLTVQ